MIDIIDMKRRIDGNLYNCDIAEFIGKDIYWSLTYNKREELINKINSLYDKPEKTIRRTKI